MWYAVYDNGYDYIKGVYSEQEYQQSFGRLHPDYRPRVQSFETRAEADKFMAEQNAKARIQYSV